MVVLVVVGILVLFNSSSRSINIQTVVDVLGEAISDVVVVVTGVVAAVIVVIVIVALLVTVNSGNISSICSI